MTPARAAIHRTRLRFLLPFCPCILFTPGCTPTRTTDAPNASPAPSATTRSENPAGKPSTVLWLRKPWPCDVFRSDSADPAAVAVYVFGRGGLEGKGPMPWLVLALWPDGTVVSSTDTLLGGKPYVRSRIAPEAVADLTRTLTNLAVQSGVASNRYFGKPDYPATSLQFRAPDGRIYGLASGHEWEEQDGEHVVTERDTMPLRPGQSAEKVLQDNSGYYYLKFRRHWSDLRRRITAALPPATAPAPDTLIRFSDAPGR